MPKNVLALARETFENQDWAALPQIAERLSVLAKAKSHLVPALLRIADRLYRNGDYAASLDACYWAVRSAPSGSPEQEQAVEGWSKCYGRIKTPSGFKISMPSGPVDAKYGLRAMVYAFYHLKFCEPLKNFIGAERKYMLPGWWESACREITAAKKKLGAAKTAALEAPPRSDLDEARADEWFNQLCDAAALHPRLLLPHAFFTAKAAAMKRLEAGKDAPVSFLEERAREYCYTALNMLMRENPEKAALYTEREGFKEALGGYANKILKQLPAFLPEAPTEADARDFIKRYPKPTPYFL